MTAVPRLFEKVYHKIIKKGLSQKVGSGGSLYGLLDVGQRYAEAKDKGSSSVRPWLCNKEWQTKLVFSKWREGVGGRLRYFVSGGATFAGTFLRIPGGRDS